MRSVGALCLATLCLAATSLAKVETEDGVLVVTKDNFDSVIRDNDYVLLEFCEYNRSFASAPGVRARPHNSLYLLLVREELHPRACTFCTWPLAAPRPEDGERNCRSRSRFLRSHDPPVRSADALAGPPAPPDASSVSTSSFEHPRGATIAGSGQLATRDFSRR